MFAPIVCHIEWKTPVEPVKWTPASCGARERGVADRRAGPVDEVDHARRQAGLLEEVHEEVRGVAPRCGRLPDDRVAHQRGARREVAADRGEVERRDREDEALERPVLHPVPDARRGDRLLLVDARHELDVEAQEVDQLAGGVDLGLVRGLRLAEHRRGVERRAPRAGEQLGGAQEDRGALLPGQARPVLPRLAGGADRALDLGLRRPGGRRRARGSSGAAHGLERVAGRTSSPPITSGSSMRSACIWSSRRRSSSRSGEPGA